VNYQVLLGDCSNRTCFDLLVILSVNARLSCVISHFLSIPPLQQLIISTPLQTPAMACNYLMFPWSSSIDCSCWFWS
jgi:hypothetical protein